MLFWRRLERRVALGVEEARLGAYASAIVWPWVFVTAVLTWWMVAGRSAATLGLLPSRGIPFVVTLSVSVVLSLLLLHQVRSVRSLAADAVETLRRRIAPLAAVIPHSAGERSVFFGVALTAGAARRFCIAAS